MRWGMLAAGAVKGAAKVSAAGVAADEKKADRQSKILMEARIHDRNRGEKKIDDAAARKLRLEDEKSARIHTAKLHKEGRAEKKEDVTGERRYKSEVKQEDREYTAVLREVLKQDTKEITDEARTYKEGLTKEARTYSDKQLAAANERADQVLIDKFGMQLELAEFTSLLQKPARDTQEWKTQLTAYKSMQESVNKHMKQIAGNLPVNSLEGTDRMEYNALSIRLGKLMIEQQRLADTPPGGQRGILNSDTGTGTGDHSSLWQ